MHFKDCFRNGRQIYVALGVNCERLRKHKVATEYFLNGFDARNLRDRDLGDKERKYCSYLNLGISYERLKRKYLNITTALTLAKEMDYKDAESDAYRFFGNVYFEIGKYQEAITY